MHSTDARSQSGSQAGSQHFHGGVDVPQPPPDIIPLPPSPHPTPPAPDVPPEIQEPPDVGDRQPPVREPGMPSDPVRTGLH